MGDGSAGWGASGGGQAKAAGLPGGAARSHAGVLSVVEVVPSVDAV